MNLSSDLITQFVKVTNDKTEAKKESTVYGTIKEYNGSMYLKIDGSDLLTPISTTTDVKAEERVTATIKNHTVIVNGNVSSPSARVDDVKQVGTKITEMEIAIADKVSTEQLEVEKARIDTLTVENATIKETLTAAEADIDKLQAGNLNVSEQLTATEAEIESLKATKLDAAVADVKFATIEALEATDLKVYNLNATYTEFVTATTEHFTAVDASITVLKTDKLSVEDAKVTYANIDFSNIGQAAMEYFYAQSGLIENVTISEGTITGNLVGVTIRGDVIEGGTVVADKLVIQGEDGLYYKLNTDGATTSTEQTEYNSLNGQVILAKSVTATQISVDDLVAFDATIGGFTISENAIYSDVKDSEDNTTRGTYLGADGQVNFGDADKFIKYYQDEDGAWKLAISADTVMYSLDGKQYSVADLGVIGEYVKIGTYEDEPCIELGETDSDFKLLITNTRIMFMEGIGVPAYINNQSLHIKKAVIEEELQQGEFVWKARSNGNLGLIWKGVTS